MRDLPKLVSLDYETCDSTGLGSLEFWRPDFRVKCASFVWRDESGLRSYWTTAPYDILQYLTIHMVPIAAHNISFEMAVTRWLYPQCNLLWTADTLRLTALYDAGGINTDDYIPELDELGENAPQKRTGLSLSCAAKRILGCNDSKAEADRKIKELFPEARAEDYGRYKVKLPEADLRVYNIGDSLLTYQLYEHITAAFEDEGYDWRPDHELYLNNCRLINEAKARGVLVDRDALTNSQEEVRNSILSIERQFLDKMSESIQVLENRYWDEAKSKYKTDRGRIGCQKPTFNVGSGQQLADLFVGELKCEVKFKTPTGAPSTKAAHLNQFGESGEILLNRKKLMVVGNQMDRLLELSERDSYWHLDLKPNGTKTMRFAGTGGLNAQGMARRFKPLMACIVAEPGRLLASSDAVACEPTISAEVSGDANYRAAVLDMVGLAPYWDKAGVLQISDIYLQVASVSPLGRAAIKEAWARDWDGRTFAEQWVLDDEVIKKYLKKTRTFHKVMCLGMGYGLGWKKAIVHAYNAGYTLSAKDSKDLHNEYWQLYKDIRKLSQYLGNEIKKNGHIYNLFGLRLVPPEHKAYNYLVQSSASGLLSLYTKILLDAAPYARFQTLVHDEIILDIPADKVDDFKVAQQATVHEVNSGLQWSVPVRFGLNFGKDWYEIKG